MTKSYDVIFFSSDPYIEESQMLSSFELTNWMWQECGRHYQGPSLTIAWESHTGNADEEVFDVFLGNRKHFFTARLLSAGTTDTLLLSFNIPQNTDDFKNPDFRNLQNALVIGFCAAKWLRKKQIEGRSYILTNLYSLGLQLERTRYQMEDFNLTFEEAQSLVSHDTAMIFNTHPDRKETLSFLEVNALLKNYVTGYGVNWAKFLAQGTLGTHLEEKVFSLKKFAAHFVTIWPTLSEAHEVQARSQLTQAYSNLSISDIPVLPLTMALPIAENFPAKSIIQVLFDMRGDNFEVLSEIFNHPLWSERHQHRLFDFKCVFIKDQSRNDEDFQTSDGRAFVQDQIIVNTHDLGSLQDLASHSTLYVRGEIFSHLADDLLSLYLFSKGCQLFMDDKGWWQKGFRFDFGRRWEEGRQKSDYFIEQFFDVLLPLYGNENDYQLKQQELAKYLSENYSSEKMAQNLSHNLVAKLGSFHEHLNCFELSNFKKLNLSLDGLSRYWNTLSALNLDIEGEYFILESEALPANFLKGKCSYFDVSEIEIELALYAPKIEASLICCELIVFNQSGSISKTVELELTKTIGKGSSQVLTYSLAPHSFPERTIISLRMTPRLGHFEFPFEAKLSAWL